MYFFPGSFFQEENWADSVHNHNNEHVMVWVISMRFVSGKSCIILAK